MFYSLTLSFLVLTPTVRILVLRVNLSVAFSRILISVEELMVLPRALDAPCIFFEMTLLYLLLKVISLKNCYSYSTITSNCGARERVSLTDHCV